MGCPKGARARFTISLVVAVLTLELTNNLGRKIAWVSFIHECPSHEYQSHSILLLLQEVQALALGTY